MPTYKLVYFNTKGRAEISRWILAQAGVKYEDVRITKEQWAELKPGECATFFCDCSSWISHNFAVYVQCFLIYNVNLCIYILQIRLQAASHILR